MTSGSSRWASASSSIGEEQIVTLLSPGAEAILAQSQFPTSAFRAFIVLLKSPRGASYAELLAGLHCSEEVIKLLLAARTTDDVPEFHALAYHWQEHLVAATAGWKGTLLHWSANSNPSGGQSS